MASRVGYTRETVERALDIHTESRLLRGWQRHPDRIERWYASVNGGDTLELRSLREAFVFVQGLGSAANRKG